ncbi:MAG: tyrosine-type recombinase/integrase [Pyrinomonadaceae bacterium]
MRFVKMLTEPEPRERFLSNQEKTNLFEVLRDNNQLLAIVLIGLTTGWRKGQILSVKKQDLDCANQAVTIIKSKRNPARKIIVPDFIWRIFQCLADEAKSEWLFYNEKTGKRLGDSKTAWRTALRRAGIEGLHFHDIRHTFATELFDLGGREFTVQTALGHSDIKTTRGYTHVRNEVLRQQLNELGNRQDFNDYSISKSGKKGFTD